MTINLTDSSVSDAAESVRPGSRSCPVADRSFCEKIEVRNATAPFTVRFFLFFSLLVAVRVCHAQEPGYISE